MMILNFLSSYLYLWNAGITGYANPPSLYGTGDQTQGFLHIKEKLCAHPALFFQLLKQLLKWKLISQI